MAGKFADSTDSSRRDALDPPATETGGAAELFERDRLGLLDTTLRDGEQAPGVSMDPDEKAAIARSLDRAGVDVIEAGSACTGAGERDAITRVAALDLDARVTSFCRGVREDVDLARECGVDGVHIVVPASDRHLEGKVGTSREANLDRTAELVTYAVDHDLWVEVIGEDGSRADLAYLETLAARAFEAGADRFCFADTVGHTGPERTAEAVARLVEVGPVSAHTHDDLGLGVANALAAADAGADLVHCTVNGIGERAGNVALEEVAIALSHVYDVETVALDEVYDLAQLVARASGIPLPANKAVVGDNAFTHESGIHTDGTLKDDRMYEPYPPDTVGRERRLVLGKHAGRAGVRAALADLGVSATDDQVAAIAGRVTALGDGGRRVTDADLLAIADDVTGDDRERTVELTNLTATSGGSVPTASVRLEVAGEERVASGTGAGPVDAAIAAVREALGPAADVELDTYRVDAVSGGTDAVVTVEVELRRDDRSVTVVRSDADITRASVAAVVDSIDRLLDEEATVDLSPAD
ncbi:2-isopropylmalate synthase [Halovivax cerinus]|uniref:2-isopropylmalate synthase n=1 Tax=Halovivax cerinus TaxID=1487865 RepID=A0ABD5NPH5_9EURY